jgi:hypothetical protein
MLSAHLVAPLPQTQRTLHSFVARALSLCPFLPNSYVAPCRQSRRRCSPGTGIFPLRIGPLHFEIPRQGNVTPNSPPIPSHHALPLRSLFLLTYPFSRSRLLLPLLKSHLHSFLCFCFALSVYLFPFAQKRNLGGAIIGRGGAIIRQLRETHAANIALTAGWQGHPDRLVALTGLRHEVMLAFAAITTAIWTPEAGQVSFAFLSKSQ